MPKPKRKVSLLFKADVVVTVEALSADAETFVDKILEDITVNKSKIPCG